MAVKNRALYKISLVALQSATPPVTLYYDTLDEYKDVVKFISNNIGRDQIIQAGRNQGSVINLKFFYQAHFCGPLT